MLIFLIKSSIVRLSASQHKKDQFFRTENLLKFMRVENETSTNLLSMKLK